MTAVTAGPFPVAALAVLFPDGSAAMSCEATLARPRPARLA